MESIAFLSALTLQLPIFISQGVSVVGVFYFILSSRSVAQAGLEFTTQTTVPSNLWLISCLGSLPSYGSPPASTPFHPMAHLLPGLPSILWLTSCLSTLPSYGTPLALGPQMLNYRCAILHRQDFGFVCLFLYIFPLSFLFVFHFLVFFSFY